MSHLFSSSPMAVTLMMKMHPKIIMTWEAAVVAPILAMTWMMTSTMNVRTMMMIMITVTMDGVLVDRLHARRISSAKGKNIVLMADLSCFGAKFFQSASEIII